MVYISNTRDFGIEEPTVVTIGKFDGRHKGHQKLLWEILQIKRKYGLATAIFIFNMVPVVPIQGQPRTVVTTNQEQRNNMGKMGINYLVEYLFSKEAAHLPSEEFVSRILLGQIDARAIAVGADCGSDYQRIGNVKLLRELVPKCSYILEMIGKTREDNRDISSAYIKKELSMGVIEKANGLLGGPYTIHGTVVYGNHIGGVIFSSPTVNTLPSPEEHLLPLGVYALRVLIDGTYYGGITNIGKKPTVGGEYPTGVETFVFNFDRDIYGENIEVQLPHFKRPEQRFASLEDLRRQLEKDKEYGLRYLKKHGLAWRRLNGKRFDRQEILRYTKSVQIYVDTQFPGFSDRKLSVR